MKNKTVDARKIWRGVFYAVGMVVLACGIVLNTKSGLGVAPIVSVPYTVSELTGLNFSNLTFAWYCLFIVGEFVLRGKNRQWKDLLQLPVSYVFTRFMNMFSVHLNVNQEVVQGWCHSFFGIFGLDITPHHYIAGGLIAFTAVAITGVGIVLSTNMRVVPNAGDGIVQALSDVTHIKQGNMKNIFDISCACISLIMGFVFGGSLYGVGVATVIALLFTGISVTICNKLFTKRVMKLCYTQEDWVKYTADI
ncbi:MAG: DUF6198 family protein [Oscillospiraceae bacterium]|nr:DUF6198 family protein [Oscillospiraceae bacterium]